MSIKFLINPHVSESNCPASSKFKQNKLNEQNEVSQTKSSINPFICSNNQCKICFCADDNQSSHKKSLTQNVGIHSTCFIGKYNRLLACLQQKKKDCETLKNSINKIFDDFIDYLSELRQKYIGELNYCGLSQNQRKFFSCFENGKFNQVTSQLGYSIIKQLDQSLAGDILLTNKKLEDFWLKEEKSLNKSFQLVEEIILNQKIKSIDVRTIGSKIMNLNKQKEDLIMMLQDQQAKTVQQMNLLYRASQNDFDVSKFHQKCDMIEHTVVVIQTEHGKKIGGYTPLEWDRKINKQQQKNSSGKSFIFSLTNNHKFILKSKDETAIIQYQNQGPTFGKGNSDIYIQNKGNIKDCNGNIGNSYTHPDYKYNDKETWKKFSGVIGGYQFKVKEWEVFQVKWKQV